MHVVSKPALNVCSGTGLPSTFYYFHISDLRTYPRIVSQVVSFGMPSVLARGREWRREVAGFICLAQTVIAVPMHDSILEPEGYKFQECYGSNSNMFRPHHIPYQPYQQGSQQRQLRCSYFDFTTPEQKAIRLE